MTAPRLTPATAAKRLRNAKWMWSLPSEPWDRLIDEALAEAAAPLEAELRECRAALKGMTKERDDQVRRKRVAREKVAEHSPFREALERLDADIARQVKFEREHPDIGITAAYNSGILVGMKKARALLRREVGHGVTDPNAPIGWQCGDPGCPDHGLRQEVD
jgi:hypothetical protein